MTAIIGSSIELNPGQVLFSAGQPGDCAYLIESGRIGVEIERDGQIVEIAQLGRGQVIGEMAIIDGMPRSATVRCIEPTVLLVVTQEQLMRRIETADPVVKACLKTLLSRMRSTLDLVRSPVSGAGPADGTDELAAPFEHTVDELRLEQELRAGLARREFTLHYQPIVQLETERITGFEALMRWQHPIRGLIPPAKFIPQIETNGLIIPITEWAMEEVCWSLQSFDLSRCLNLQAIDEVQISLNISAVQLLSVDFLPKIRELCEILGKNTERLSLEITESVLVACPDTAAEKLKVCRDLGFGVSIDDFGTGYSSLNYLSKLPATRIKLDRSFVDRLDTNDVNRKIVQCVLGMSHGLDLPVIAEGVERLEEAQLLMDLGCEQAQGYYFGKPKTSAETLDLIKCWKRASPTSSQLVSQASSYRELHAQLDNTIWRNAKELNRS